MHRTLFWGSSAQLFVFEIIQNWCSEFRWFLCHFKAGNRSNPTTPWSWHISIWLLRYLVKCEKCLFFRILSENRHFSHFIKYLSNHKEICYDLGVVGLLRLPALPKSSEFATSILDYFKNKKLCALVPQKSVRCIRSYCRFC